MENATEALLMAFAVLIFVVALSVTFTTLAQAKSTADVILYYSDRESFQSFTKYKKQDFLDGGRDVTVDTVIATISRCIKEKFSVYIDDGNETYNLEYDVSTEEEIRNTINKFIDEHNGTTYRETYVEVTTSGQTFFGEDGSLLEEDVGRKIYITYTKKD